MNLWTGRAENTCRPVKRRGPSCISSHKWQRGNGEQLVKLETLPGDSVHSPQGFPTAQWGKCLHRHPTPITTEPAPRPAGSLFPGTAVSTAASALPSRQGESPRPWRGGNHLFPITQVPFISSLTSGCSQGLF